MKGGDYGNREIRLTRQFVALAFYFAQKNRS
jgi:hypothetical protein